MLFKLRNIGLKTMKTINPSSMIVLKDLQLCNFPHGSVVTVGTFDGLHLGHKTLLNSVVEVAKQKKIPSIVVSFYPHPRLFLTQDETVLRLINMREEKLLMLENIGIDYYLEIAFTRAFSKMSAHEFVETYLVNKLSVSTLVIGHDHRFGNDRKGGEEAMAQFGNEMGFSIRYIPAFQKRGVTVSSTLIRKFLKQGLAQEAFHLLGYPFAMTGNVVQGNHNGRKIGFPTANVFIKNRFKLLIGNGVYATYVTYKGKRYRAMTNVGYRPTIGDNKYAVEVHLFHFNEEIYGEQITVEFLKRIRDEVRFSSLATLKIQLEEDFNTVNAFFD